MTPFAVPFSVLTTVLLSMPIYLTVDSGSGLDQSGFRIWSRSRSRSRMQFSFRSDLKYFTLVWCRWELSTTVLTDAGIVSKTDPLAMF
ncbi:hypothetical protein EVAR_67077_1 [Eumeta japonica]|uniref:Secreted protein n=1 Tax=Eumeta variegata TaxID=151549 RepID=A0A4C2A839_EUMVA|nr:hypothetical protein EVAR_67077_1 [Eumeta japonica]